MGFIIWYKLEFHEEQAAGGPLAQVASNLPLGTTLPLRVSNDVFSGKYILDADIELKMLGGPIADTLQIKLVNLPADVAEELKNKQSEAATKGQNLLVDIYLGYFDDDTSKVTKPSVRGAVTSVHSKVNEEGLLETVVKGQELGAYKLRTKSNVLVSAQHVTADEILKKILENTGVTLAPTSYLSQQFENFTLSEINGLKALQKFTSDNNGNALVPLVVTDNTLYVGPAVGKNEAPVHFSQDLNIVQLDQRQDNEEDDTTSEQSENDQVKSNASRTLDITVLGHPGLRVGQKIILDAKLENPPQGTLRINQLTHSFSTRRGYTCQASVVEAEAGEVVSSSNGVHRMVSNLSKMAQNVRKSSIDVGQIEVYEPGSQQKHRVTLSYGQPLGANAATPSVDVTVDDTSHLYSKTISSPFAWHKCGLIVPAYKGMRALLAHNLDLVNDAIVTGYLWPEQPQYARPKNEEGDYWLCLPTALDGNGQPTGKGANDLIDRQGLRTIEAKGLRILVGNTTSDVGERPDVPDQQTIVIEHDSGTKITIANDGAINITTQGKDIILSNNSVTLKLGSTGVEVK